jgi:hypothetical protein
VDLQIIVQLKAKTGANGGCQYEEMKTVGPHNRTATETLKRRQSADSSSCIAVKIRFINPHHNIGFFLNFRDDFFEFAGTAVLFLTISFVVLFKNGREFLHQLSHSQFPKGDPIP